MLIACNWKSYVETREKAKALYATAKRLGAVKRVKLVLIPSAPHLGLLAPLNRSKVLFGVQDVTAVNEAAATGEISAATARSVGATYAIVGHSERRAKGETDAIVAEKVKRVLANGLIPILCIGEKVRDEDATYLSTLKQQLMIALDGLAPKDRSRVVIAYEPIWAIGKHADQSITEPDLAEMVLYIKKIMGEVETGKPAKNLVLYGGSVEAENIRSLAGGSGIDGFLIGHASTDPKTFTAVVKALA